MSRKILLRIAAFLILIHLLGHAIGHVTWESPEDPQMQEVVKHMKSHAAEFMGATKSMADYYNGYSIILFGLYGMSILILWTLSSTGENEKAANKIIGIMGVAYLYFSVVEYIFFFPFAACISGSGGVLLLGLLFFKGSSPKKS